MALHLGVDLGGTKIEAALVELTPAPDGDLSFEVLVRRRIPTDAHEGYEAIVGRVASLVHDVVREVHRSAGPPPSVGIGLPGAFSSRTGLVKNANTQCLNGRPFREDLAVALGPSWGPAGAALRFENDANCLALAEVRLGAAKTHRRGVVFAVILGTGVGGGLVAGGQLLPGRHGIAGEWGHHTLHTGGEPCYCGRRGCVETYLSGPALGRRFSAELGRPTNSSEGVALAGEGDPIAVAAFDKYLDDFGQALGNVVNILDPDAIVLGGGLSNLDALFDRGRARLAQNVFNDELTTPIMRAQLGDSAGVFGAALLGLPAD